MLVWQWMNFDELRVRKYGGPENVNSAKEHGCSLDWNRFEALEQQWTLPELQKNPDNHKGNHDNHEGDIPGTPVLNG